MGKVRVQGREELSISTVETQDMTSGKTHTSRDEAAAHRVDKSAHHHRPRLFYLDFIRAFATILIVITHFNNPFLTVKGAHPIFFNRPFNIYVGDWGVSLFLIISGAALMYTHGTQKKTDWKRFYYRRFITIFPMYWIAYIVVNLCLFIRGHGSLPYSAPKWRILLSVFAFDGLASTGGIKTFYTLGEWFLGFIIIFYLIYPLMQAGVRDHPWTTAMCILALYCVTVVYVRFIDVSHTGVTINGYTFPAAILLTMRLPELAFGMYFTHYMKKINPWAGLIALAFLVVQCIYPFAGLLLDDIAVTTVGIASFVILVWIARWFDIAVIKTSVKWIARYSYPIFLVHHQLITFVFRHVGPTTLNVAQTYLLFAVDCIVIGITAVILDLVEKQVLSGIRFISCRRQIHRTKAKQQ